MDDQELNERLRDIVSRFCDPGPRVAGSRPPFDISPISAHETKAEFLVEVRQVDQVIAQADKLFECLGTIAESDAEGGRTSLRIDEAARADRPSGRAVAAPDVVRGSAIDTGVFLSSLIVLHELRMAAMARRRELSSEETMYWRGKGRPPNLFARTIALRLAKVIARGTGKMPTVGTSSEGNHPSTEFGRAVEEVFQLLNIDADFKRASRWAVEQLTEEDTRPLAPRNHLASIRMGEPWPEMPTVKNALIDYLTANTKVTEQ